MPGPMTYTICDGTYNQINDVIVTVLCAMPDTPRGQYDEEIDVKITNGGGRRYNQAEVRRVAQAELDANYAEGLRIKRLVRGGL